MYAAITLRLVRMDSSTLFRQLWPDYRPTPLIELPTLAKKTGTARVLLKCEAERPLGSFKVLGGMTAAIRALARHTNVPIPALLSRATSIDTSLVCATDGNHGLAVAAAAARCGIQAFIYLPAAANPARARRIEAQGAQITHVSGTYDDAVLAAREAAEKGDRLLIADTSDQADEIVNDVMCGYELLATELRSQLTDQAYGTPSHVFVQAGVGGLAAAIARGLMDHLEQPSKLFVVEPAAAPCIAEGLKHGRAVRVPGALLTSAEMLSCGVASTPALKILESYNVECILVDERELAEAPRTLTEHKGPETTSSGATGLAGFLRVAASSSLREKHCVTANSTVLFIVTEGVV
jgi:diaminopropionate ammonia-lyase